MLLRQRRAIQSWRADHDDIFASKQARVIGFPQETCKVETLRMARRDDHTPAVVKETEHQEVLSPIEDPLFGRAYF